MVAEAAGPCPSLCALGLQAAVCCEAARGWRLLADGRLHARVVPGPCTPSHHHRRHHHTRRRRYNTAFPLPVIGRCSLDEVKAMACSARLPVLGQKEWCGAPPMQTCLPSHLPAAVPGRGELRGGVACCRQQEPPARCRPVRCRYNTIDQSCCARHLTYMERPYLVMSWLHVGGWLLEGMSRRWARGPRAAARGSRVSMCTPS